MEYTKLLRKLIWNPASRSTTVGLGTATVADGVYAGISHWSAGSVSVLQDLFSDQEWAIYLSLAMSTWLLGSSTWALCLELPRICYVQHNKKRAIEGSDKDLEQGGATSPIVSTCCGVSERTETPTLRLVLKISDTKSCLSALDALCRDLVDQIDRVHPKTSSKMPCLPGCDQPNYGTMSKNYNVEIERQIVNIKPFLEQYRDQDLNEKFSVITTVAGDLLRAKNMHQKKSSMTENANKQALLKQKLMNGMNAIKDRVEACEKALQESLESGSTISLTSDCG